MPNFDWNEYMRRAIEHDRQKNSGTTPAQTADVTLTTFTDEERTSLLEQFSVKEQRQLCFYRWMVEQGRLTDFPKEGDTGVSL